MPNLKYDIVIIGGGPAGSTAACYLAKNGFSVCVIEKKIFPRETLCGEFLSYEVIENIKQLNLLNAFMELKPNKISKFRMINENIEIFSPLNFPAYSLKRSLLDNFLLCAAKDAGADIIQGEEVISIQNLSGKYLINIKNSEKKILAGHVIAAYGRQSPLDKVLNRNFVKNKSRFNGIKYHLPKKYFNLPNADEIQIYCGENIYCGVNKTSSESYTVCFLEYRNNSMSSKNRIYEFFEKNKSFQNLFTSDLKEILPQLQVYGAGNIYFSKKNVVENGIFMIGDAAGIIAPLAGDGIGMAMDSAKIISGVFEELKSNNLSKEKLEILYQEKWKENFNRRIRTALFIQTILMNNFTRKISLKLTSLFPLLIPRLIKITRN